MPELLSGSPTALELGRAIRSRAISPLEVVEHYLERIESDDTQLNSFVWLDPQARQQAAMATERLADHVPSSPVFGVPVAFKDVQNVAGQPNSKCSLALPETPVTESDLFTERIVAAGMVSMGRTASSELASALCTDSIKHGPTTNPWDRTRSPGGSSGGSAAAVAAGLTPAATATDGFGSTRLPAAFCGLVGLKPQRGRIPQRVPNWEGSSVEGFLSRDIADTAALLELVASPDPYGWMPSNGTQFKAASVTGKRPTGLRVAILAETREGIPVASAAVEAAEEVAQLLAGTGKVRIFGPELIDSPAIELYGTNVGPVGSHLLDYDLDQPMHPAVAARLSRIDDIDTKTYARAVAEVKRLNRELVRPFIEDFDVLVTPTSPMPPPPAGALLQELSDSDSSGQLAATLSYFLRWVNVAGLPALSVPTHTYRDGMPLGVQLVGAPFREAQLLSLGLFLEHHYRWLERPLPIQPASTHEIRGGRR